MVVWSLRLSTRPSVALEYATILSYVLQKDFVCTELLGELYERVFRIRVPRAHARRSCGAQEACLYLIPGFDDDGPLE